MCGSQASTRPLAVHGSSSDGSCSENHPQSHRPPAGSRGIIVSQDRTDALISLCKRRGFVFPSSEIYGGTRSAWDYGPLGVELKENIRREWWNAMVRQRDDVVGLDSAVVLNRQVWEASGHVKEFTDPL